MEKQGEGEVLVDMAKLEEFSKLLHSQPKKLNSKSLHHRQIQKVPAQTRRRSEQVSIGPYHHGQPGLRQAEELKHLCLHRCAGGAEKKNFKILEQISDIRDCFAEATIVAKYDDQSLELMMLLDASIMVDFIHNYQGMKGNSSLDWQRCLGAGSTPLMARDLMVMENQIPFQVLKLLIRLQYEEGDEASGKRGSSHSLSGSFVESSGRKARRRRRR